MKKKNFIIISSIFFLMFLYLLGYNKTWATNAVTIRVAGDNSHPPFEYVDENGIYKGFNVDIMRAIAIEKGIDIEFVPMSWHDALEALNNGDVDIIQGMSKTSSREKKYLFLTPTITNSQVIFVKSDNKIIQELEDLSDFKVAYQESDVNEEKINKMPKLIPISKKNQTEGMLSLINGEVQAFIGDKEVGLYNLQKFKQFNSIKIVGEPVSTVKYGIVTTKDNEAIANLLNEGIAQIKSDGTYDKIYRKWFGEQYIEKKNVFSLFIEQISIIVLIVFIIISFMYLWNKQLVKQVGKRTNELQKANEKLISHRNQIYNLAYYDTVTGLPNRLYFFEVFEEILEESEGESLNIAVLYIDLDRFKDINDSLGHDTGDKVLNIVGIRLKNILRPWDFLARFGGDEFLILMKYKESKNEVTEFANEIIKEMQEPFSIYDVNQFLTCSIGISIYPEGGKDVNSLIKNADMAMYKAKEIGKNTYFIYYKQLSEIEIKKVKLLNQLREAKENDEFVLFYQPKVEVTTDKILGMEALIRWDNPTEGLLGPDRFIPLAEETDIILPIGEWVLREACRQNKYWLDSGYGPIRVSVNISARQFLQKYFVKKVETILKEENLEPKYLELEITESIAVMNIDYTLNILKDLKDLGVYISIDDFGTGYSSLNYLKEMCVDELKIDRTFVKDINLSNKSMSIIKSTIHLAHEMGLKVTAEGAETKEHVQFLKEQNCNQIQGYYYSKPVPPIEVEKLLIKCAKGCEVK